MRERLRTVEDQSPDLVRKYLIHWMVFDRLLYSVVFHGERERHDRGVPGRIRRRRSGGIIISGLCHRNECKQRKLGSISWYYTT